MKTEHALSLALKDMMAHQPIDTISVLELSKKCGISRKTFYYHYHDIYDLLTQVFLEEKIQGVMNAEDYRSLIECVFNYYKHNEEFINATINSSGKELFFEFIYNAFYTAGLRFISKIDVDKKLTLSARKSIARFYAYGYGNSTVYYLSNYRNKTLTGLLNSFSFIEPKNFEFVSPTKIYFGHDREREIGQILNNLKIDRILIVIGKNSVIKSGLLERVVESLTNARIEYVLLKGVRANPTFDLVEEGVKLVRENNLQFILPIGGGSVIDTAKCIAVNYDYAGDIHDFNFHKATPNHALPIGVILTIAAAGSELSSSCVIQDDETNVKMGFNSDLIRPVFAIENPDLTKSVSKEQTAYGIVDTIMHSFERYFSYSEEYMLADEFALGLIKNVFDVGLLCYNNPDNYEYRARIMLASSYSHNGITSIGKPHGMFVHKLEHPVSGMFENVAHGCGLAVLWPAWAKYYYKYDVDKFCKLGERVFNLHMEDKNEMALATIHKIEEYFKALGMPSTLTELGIKEEDIDALVDNMTEGGTKVISHHGKDMDAEVARIIYNSCMR